MSYANQDATFSPELHAVVEQAMAADTKFIADILFPQYPVETRTGEYMRINRGKGQLLAKAGKEAANDPLLRAPNTEYREVTSTEEKDSWACQDRGLRQRIDDTVAQNTARFYDKRAQTARNLMRNMRISREARVAAIAFNEDNFGPAIDATAIPFTDANLATFDFPTFLRKAKLQIEKRQEDAALHLVMSNVLMDRVQRSTKLRQYFFGDLGGSADISNDMIAQKFGLAGVLVGKGSYDTTKEGKDADDDSLVWTWPEDMFGIFNIQGGAPEAGGCGRTFVLEQLTGGQLFVTEEKWHWGPRSTTIRVREDDQSKVINGNSGVLVQVQ